MLVSGNYLLIDGHIYHRNKIIKIRYDMIEKNHGGEDGYWDIHKVFDTFD